MWLVWRVFCPPSGKTARHWMAHLCRILCPFCLSTEAVALSPHSPAWALLLQGQLHDSVTPLSLSQNTWDKQFKIGMNLFQLMISEKSVHGCLAALITCISSGKLLWRRGCEGEELPGSKERVREGSGTRQPSKASPSWARHVVTVIQLGSPKASTFSWDSTTTWRSSLQWQICGTLCYSYHSMPSSFFKWISPYKDCSVWYGCLQGQTYHGTAEI